MTPEQALASVVKEQDLVSDVLIVGYWNDGELFVRSSRMDRKDALWLAESLKNWARDGAD
jgi:hypothetical protein